MSKPFFAFPQIRSLGAALGIVAAVLLGSGILARLLVPGMGAPRAGWSPTLFRSNQENDSLDSTLLRRLRILQDTAQRRLLAVMIENHDAARPHQEGLTDALLIWEFPVEGFITRFAAVFDADHLPERSGPVRSLRPYFTDALRPWVGAVIHAGASPEAYDQAARGDIRAINLLAYYGNAERDPAIPEPHNLFIRRDRIAELPGPAVSGTPWPPYAIGTPVNAPAAVTLRINFYNPDHDVTYVYSRLHDAYVRSSGPVEDQGRPRNVLVLEMPVTKIGEMGRLTIPVEGRGRALLFRGGTVQEGFWDKQKSGKNPALLTPFSFTAADGSALLFAPGQTWVTVVPGFDRVRWE